MTFSKKEQTIVNFWRFFQEAKEKLENISLMSENTDLYDFLISVKEDHDCLL